MAEAPSGGGGGGVGGVVQWKVGGGGGGVGGAAAPGRQWRVTNGSAHEGPVQAWVVGVVVRGAEGQRAKRRGQAAARRRRGKQRFARNARATQAW